MTNRKSAQGLAAYGSGLKAERIAETHLTGEGYTILARRLRTPYGELDLIAASQDTLLFVEVKQRRSLTESAFSLTTRQSERLLQAADYTLQTRPDWQRDRTRFDLIILDALNNARRIQDILREQ